MAITEAKLSDALGYTNGQIRHRRLHTWEKGIHYWPDPANTTVYDLEAIEQWQKLKRPEWSTNVESARLDGLKVTSVVTKRSRSHTPQLT